MRCSWLHVKSTTLKSRESVGIICSHSTNSPPSQKDDTYMLYTSSVQHAQARSRDYGFTNQENSSQSNDIR